MNILRSGPFPRKSSGACLFLLGLLGLSSTVLFNRKQERQMVIFLTLVQAHANTRTELMHMLVD